MVERLPTGIPLLDDELEGGVPVGSLITLEARPDSQSDLFIYEFSQPRPTVYVSTQRSKKSVEKSFEREGRDTDGIDIYEASGTNSLGDVRGALDDLAEGSTVIIDKTDKLERQDGYDEFLRAFQDHLIETDSVGILYCSEGPGTPPSRQTTKGISDVVFSLRTEIRGEDIDNRLAVLKARGGPTLDELIKLQLRGEVRVDRSRDIA